MRQFSKYSGVAAVLVLWLAIPWGMYVIGLNLFDNRPISYLGVDPKTKLLFDSSLIIAAILMMLFGAQVKKTFHASKSFLTVLILGQLCQVIAAIVSDSCSMRLVHTTAAYGIAFSLPLLMWRFVVCQPKGYIRRLSNKLFLAELASLIVGIGLFVLVNGVGPFGEILTVVFFHIWVIFITVHWRADKSTPKLTPLRSV